jgi:hypothetical protein
VCVPNCPVSRLPSSADPSPASSSKGTSLAFQKRAKLKELFHPQTRFILITSGSEASDELLGFASFRFDVEDTVDSLEYADEPMADVLYM